MTTDKELKPTYSIDMSNGTDETVYMMRVGNVVKPITKKEYEAAFPNPPTDGLRSGEEKGKVAFTSRWSHEHPDNVLPWEKRDAEEKAVWARIEDACVQNAIASQAEKLRVMKLEGAGYVLRACSDVISKELADYLLNAIALADKE